MMSGTILRRRWRNWRRLPRPSRYAAIMPAVRRCDARPDDVAAEARTHTLQAVGMQGDAACAVPSLS